MTIVEWENSVPSALRANRLWTVKAYRLALFVSDEAWGDVSKLTVDPRTRGIASQLYRALGSIGANLAEGYSRSTSHDRARLYEYALGSAREAREWYARTRMLLGNATVDERLRDLTEIIKLLIVMIPSSVRPAESAVPRRRPGRMR